MNALAQSDGFFAGSSVRNTMSNGKILDNKQRQHTDNLRHEIANTN